MRDEIIFGGCRDRIMTRGRARDSMEVWGRIGCNIIIEKELKCGF
jgi:hypothetical protein